MICLAVKNGFPQYEGSTHQCAPGMPAPPSPRPHFTEKSSSQDSSTFLELLSLLWLSYHSNRPCRGCLRPFQVQGAGSPLWHHNHVFPDWPKCLSTPIKDPPPPVNSQFCDRFLARSLDLSMALLLHSPNSTGSRPNKDDISLRFQRTSNLEPTFWKTRRVFLWWVQKNDSRPLHFHQPGKLLSHWIRQLPSRNNISHHLRLFPYVDAKCTTLLTRMLLFQASLLLTSSKQTNAHTRWQEHETDHRNSLTLDKQIHSLSSKKYTGHTGGRQRMHTIS
jgi:hypothetical protein